MSLSPNWKEENLLPFRKLPSSWKKMEGSSCSIQNRLPGVVQRVPQIGSYQFQIGSHLIFVGGEGDIMGSVTKISGGRGRTRRVLGTTFPRKISLYLQVFRGGTIEWKLGKGNYVIVKPVTRAGPQPVENNQKRPVQKPISRPQRIQLNYIRCENCKEIGTVPGRTRDLCPWCLYGIPYTSWHEKFEVPE